MISFNPVPLLCEQKWYCHPSDSYLHLNTICQNIVLVNLYKSINIFKKSCTLENKILGNDMLKNFKYLFNIKCPHSMKILMINFCSFFLPQIEFPNPVINKEDTVIKSFSLTPQASHVSYHLT